MEQEKQNPEISGKFKNVPVDADTTVLMRNEVKIGDYDALMELWVYDGITASSAIFCKEDVAHLTDAAIIALIQQTFNTENVTLSRHTGAFVFANYGFTVKD